MADYAVIRHSLDLVLHLVDTTTGVLLSGIGAVFERDGRPLSLLNKGDGHLILIGSGRTDFRLTVKLRGYLTREVEIRYAELSERYPLYELPMLPDGTLPASGKYRDLQGRLEGLTALEAVWLGDNSCMLRDFNSKKKMMTIFNPHHLLLDRVFYALVNPDAKVYEALKIEERISDTQFLLQDGLKMEFGGNCPVTRRIFGLVQEDGTYLLRISDQGGDSRWLLRCIAGEREWFQTVDIRSPREPPLTLPQEEQDAGIQAGPAGKGGM